MEIRGLRETDQAAYLAYRQDFLTHDVTNPYGAGVRRQLREDDTVSAAIARAMANLNPDAEWRVPQLEYYLFTDAGVIAGKTNCRLKMTPELAVTGGHIGYVVAPSQRGHGYAQQLLRFALAFFRQRHEPSVLVSAYTNNAASRHIIEANGGVLQQVVPGEAGMAETLCIYKISL